jgi:hypothetical protein
VAEAGESDLTSVRAARREDVGDPANVIDVSHADDERRDRD